MNCRVLFFALFAFCCGRSFAADATKPNILLILADDLGYGDVRCYNDQSKVATPHLDRLAREGIRFTGAALPPEAAEGSFNLRPVLEGKATAPIRPYLLTQAFGSTSTLSIRRGNWKYIAHRGSGGNNYEKGELQRFALPETAPEASGQLYDLATDPGETTNLYSEKPEIVKELQALLEQSKTTGRSRG